MSQVFVTVLADDVHQWQVSISWKKRRELHRLEAIDAGGMIDTTRMLDVLFPECIERVDDQPAIEPEEFWNIEFAHLYQLAVLVGTYLFAGVNNSVELDEDGKPIEEEPEAEDTGDADPLPSSTAPAETATTSTPDP